RCLAAVGIRIRREVRRSVSFHRSPSRFVQCSRWPPRGTPSASPPPSSILLVPSGRFSCGALAAVLFRIEENLIRVSPVNRNKDVITGLPACLDIDLLFRLERVRDSSRELRGRLP